MPDSIRRHSVSRTGLALCIAYLAVVALCVWLTFSGEGDPKGRFVLLQLPIALQMSPFMRQNSSLEGLSWVGAYALFGIPTLIFLYGTGHVIGSWIRRMMGD